MFWGTFWGCQVLDPLRQNLWGLAWQMMTIVLALGFLYLCCVREKVTRQKLAWRARKRRLQIVSSLVRSSSRVSRSSPNRMDWKIGVTVGLSTGKNGVERPNQPFITVVLHFADETGSSSGIKSQCFEMSCSQFKDFARSIRSMGAAFENM